MEFFIESDVFIGTTQKVLANAARSIFNAYSVLRIEAYNSNIKLTTQNIVYTIRKNIYCDNIVKEGTIYLNIQQFKEILKTIRTNQVLRFIVDKNILHIISDKAKYKIALSNEQQFTTELDVVGRKFELVPEQIKTLFEDVEFAAEKHEYTNAIHSVAFIGADKTVSTRATNTRIMAYASTEVIQEIDEEFMVLLPLETVTAVAAQGESMWFQYNGGGLVYFVSDSGTIIASVLVPGDPPPFDRVIDRPKNSFIKLLKDELLEAITTVITATSSPVQVVLDMESEDSIIVSARSETNYAECKVLCSHLNFNKFKTGFMPKYILSALKKFNDNELVVAYTLNDPPFRITADSDFNGDKYATIVMPSRAD